MPEHISADVHRFPVQIYYEDTDHSGLVYHANYLKYFERAREHLLGVDALVSLWKDENIGFVVYRCELAFKEGAVFGDTIDIRTKPELASEFRIVFSQNVYRGEKLLVEGKVEMVALRDGKLTRLPHAVEARFPASRST